MQTDVAMTEAEFDRIVDEAARLLSASAFPVIAGCATDLAGAVAAIRLAERLQGAIDHGAAESSLRDQAVLHDLGLMLVSPGEARQRADTFLLVGDRPLEAWPDLPDFLFAPGRTHFSDDPPPRRILALSSREIDPPQTGSAVSRIPCDADAIPALLAALRARVNGRPLADGFDRAEIDRLAGLMLTAKFGVAIWCPAEIDALAIEMLVGLIKDLNTETRWSGISVAADVSVTGAATAAGFMTGLPLRTGFVGGRPDHDPWRFDARRLVESGEADAIVWISAFGEPPPSWLNSVPCVVLSDAVSAPAAGHVAIQVGMPGVDHDAVLHDHRTGTLVQVPASAPRQRISVAAALDRIAAKLSAP